MKSNLRITSVQKGKILDSTVTGFQSFDLANLNVQKNIGFELPQNVRLGHLVERVVSGIIRSSSNFKILYENLQLFEEKRTLGELDFILEESHTKKIIHLELAYKFYLFDPSISSEQINNWIGPNRNDSLKEKLEKLKRHQFPLLYSNAAKHQLSTIDIDKISQVLCFMVSLYIPYKYEGIFNPVLGNAIKGYYIDFTSFLNLDHSGKTYWIPSKKEWGMNPSENENWTDFERIKATIQMSITEQQATLCWEKQKESYSEYFVVWW